MAIPHYTTIVSGMQEKGPGVGLHLNLPKSETQLDAAFATPGLTKLVLDVSKGFGVIPQSIKSAKGLKFLRIENLEKAEGIIELPAIFLELDSLECLHIIKCENLDFGQKSWKNLSNLVDLFLFSSGKEFPTGILDLPRLEILHFSSCKFRSIPKEINQLQFLRKLSLNILTEDRTLPEEIAQLPALESLMVDLVEIPEWIGRCNPLLKELRLNPQKQETEVPEAIFEYKNLESLILYSVGMKLLHPKIGQLTKLKNLRLRGNELQSLPDSLANLVNLEMLDIARNQFVKIPGVIGRLPKLKDLGMEYQAGYGNELAQFERFWQWLRNDFKTKEQIEFFANLWDLKTFSLEEMDANLLFDALHSGVKPLSSYALMFLTQNSKMAFQPFKAGDTLYLLANTSIPKTGLKEKLATKNIAVSNQYNEKITHVLISENMKSTKSFWENLSKEICVLNESQLLSFLNEIQPDYLVEAEQSALLEMPQHINFLMFSLDFNNIELAFNLMKGGGVPLTAATGLFCVYKLSKDKNQAATALKYLKQIASEPLKIALKQRVDFQNIRHYTGFNGKVLIFEQTELDMLQFAIVHYRIMRRDGVFSYIISKNNPEINLEFLQLHLKNSRLDLPLNYYEIKAIPKELAKIQGIIQFRIQRPFGGDKNTLEGLFPILEKMYELQLLELEYPAEEIEINLNQLVQSLRQLKNLKIIKIYSLTDTLKNSIQQGLPNCKITK